MLCLVSIFTFLPRALLAIIKILENTVRFFVQAHFCFCIIIIQYLLCLSNFHMQISFSSWKTICRPEAFAKIRRIIMQEFDHSKKTKTPDFANLSLDESEEENAIDRKSFYFKIASQSKSTGFCSKHCMAVTWESAAFFLSFCRQMSLY